MGHNSRTPPLPRVPSTPPESPWAPGAMDTNGRIRRCFFSSCSGLTFSWRSSPHPVVFDRLRGTTRCIAGDGVGAGQDRVGGRSWGGARARRKLSVSFFFFFLNYFIILLNFLKHQASHFFGFLASKITTLTNASWRVVLPAVSSNWGIRGEPCLEKCPRAVSGLSRGCLEAVSRNVSGLSRGCLGAVLRNVSGPPQGCLEKCLEKCHRACISTQ